MELCSMLEIAHAVNERGEPGLNIVEVKGAVGTFFGSRELNVDMEICSLVSCIPLGGLMLKKRNADCQTMRILCSEGHSQA